LKKVTFVLLLLLCFLLVGCVKSEKIVSVDNKSNNNDTLIEKTDLNDSEMNEINMVNSDIVRIIESSQSNDFPDIASSSLYNYEGVETIELSVELATTLKEAYAKIVNNKLQMFNEELDGLNIGTYNLKDPNSLEILGYFGEYGRDGNIHVLMIKDVIMLHINIMLYTEKITIGITENQNFKGYSFRSSLGLPLIIDLNENKIDDLSYACNNGILSINDMDKIYCYYLKMLEELDNEK